MKKTYRIFCLTLILINSVQIFVTPEDLIKENYANFSQYELDQSLISAVQSNNVNRVKDLIQAGANIAQTIIHDIHDEEYSTMSTLIEYARIKGYEDILKELTQVKTNPNLRMAIVAASDEDDLDAVKKLIKAGVHLRYPESCCMALITASAKGNIEIAKELMRVGVDFTFNQSRAFVIASTRGDSDMMRLFIRAGADVNSVDSEDSVNNTPLINVIRHNRGNCIKAVELLLAAKCNFNYVNKNGETALTQAVSNNNPGVTQRLIQAGVDIDQDLPSNFQDSWKHKTLLGLAINKKYHEVLNEFKKVKKLLILASREGHVAFVQELVKEGFDVDFADEKGNTALMNVLRPYYRDYYSVERIIKALLQARCNVNHANKDGNTALIEAVILGDDKTVETLLKHPNINVKHVNKDGKTALAIAKEKEPSKHLDYFSYSESLSRTMIADHLRNFSK